MRRSACRTGIGRFVLFTALLTCGVFIFDAGQAIPQEGKGVKKSESVVKAKATADKPDADGKQVVTVSLAIEKSWHVYANPVPKDFPGMPTTVAVNADGKPLEVKVDYPPGKTIQDKTFGDYNVYEDKADIKVTVRRAKGDTGPLKLDVTIQACSDKQCLVESTIKVTVP